MVHSFLFQKGNKYAVLLTDFEEKSKGCIVYFGDNRLLE